MNLKSIPLGIETPAAGKPFSKVLRVGRWHFFSGIIPIVADGIPRSEDFETQVHEVVDELTERLQSCGLSANDLVMVWVRLAANPFQPAYVLFNELYLRFLTGTNPVPAREVIGVEHLPFGVKVEITCVAVNQDEDEDDL